MKTLLASPEDMLFSGEVDPEAPAPKLSQTETAQMTSPNVRKDCP
jgi:hypothetical protein